MATGITKNIKEWAEYYNVHPNFMYLVFTRLNELTNQDPQKDDNYTVANLTALANFVKEQQSKFISAKEVAETYKHRLTLKLINAVLASRRFSYITTGKCNAFFYKTDYINDIEHNFYFFKDTLFQFIDTNCPEDLEPVQLARYTGTGVCTFWSKRYESIPENLRSRWFFDNGPHKRYFRTIYFDELLHYLSLRGQKRRQEYAKTLPALPNQEANQVYSLGNPNKTLDENLISIVAEKELLKERIAELEKKEQNILCAMRKNNSQIK